MKVGRCLGLGLIATATTAVAATIVKQVKQCKEDKNQVKPEVIGEAIKIEWVCSACGAAHIVDSNSILSEMECKFCKSVTKLEDRCITGYIIKKGDTDKCCKNCCYYINKPYTPYFCQGKGICGLDQENGKPKAPHDLCHTGCFTKKDVN